MATRCCPGVIFPRRFQNKSLKTKLLSENKLCGIHTEEGTVPNREAGSFGSHLEHPDLSKASGAFLLLRMRLITLKSKKIQAQLKELRYGKRDLISKAWQNVSAEKENFPVALKKEDSESTQECDSQEVVGNKGEKPLGSEATGTGLIPVQGSHFSL